MHIHEILYIIAGFISVVFRTILPAICMDIDYEIYQMRFKVKDTIIAFLITYFKINIDI